MTSSSVEPAVEDDNVTVKEELCWWIDKELAFGADMIRGVRSVQKNAKKCTWFTLLSIFTQLAEWIEALQKSQGLLHASKNLFMALGLFGVLIYSAAIWFEFSADERRRDTSRDNKSLEGPRFYGNPWKAFQHHHGGRRGYSRQRIQKLYAS